MSIQSLCSIHSIVVLRLVPTQGNSMAAVRQYTPIGTAMGRVMPKSTLKYQLKMEPLKIKWE